MLGLTVVPTASIKHSRPQPCIAQRPGSGLSQRRLCSHALFSHNWPGHSWADDLSVRGRPWATIIGTSKGVFFLKLWMERYTNHNVERTQLHQQSVVPMSKVRPSGTSACHLNFQASQHHRRLVAPILSAGKVPATSGWSLPILPLMIPRWTLPLDWVFGSDSRHFVFKIHAGVCHCQLIQFWELEGGSVSKRLRKKVSNEHACPNLEIFVRLWWSGL